MPGLCGLLYEEVGPLDLPHALGRDEPWIRTDGDGAVAGTEGHSAGLCIPMR